MNHSILSVGIVLCLGAGAGQALAEGGLSLPPIDHAATLKECGACHMAFQPQMLPGRSWDRIMSGLSDHFGENAELPEAVRADIASYMAAHAADAPGSVNGKLFLRRVDPSAVPLRITELPYWKGAHGEVSAGKFKSAQVKSAANCQACHQAAVQGQYGEGEEE